MEIVIKLIIKVIIIKMKIIRMIIKKDLWEVDYLKKNTLIL